MPIPSKKIIHTVTNDLTYDQRMIRICTSLAKAGYQVVLVGRQLPESIPLEEQPFEQVRLACRFHSGKLFYLEYNLRLLLWLYGQSFDLINAVDLDTLLPAYLAARRRGKPCVYDAHEYFTEVPEVVNRPLTRWIWGSLAALIIPRLQHAYTVGPRLAELFTKKYRTAFATIRNLPWQQKENVLPPEAGKEVIILYQGRLNEGRGLETAISSMHLLEGAQLWLAGEGDLSEDLRAMVVREGLEDKVQFLGYLRPEALRQITLLAHIGLNLLEHKGLSYYYSLANKALDYIQAGLPSVQMDFPEYRALQEKHQVFALVDQLTPDDLAKVLTHLINHTDHWLDLHHHCLQAREELCWEEEEKMLTAFYRNIQ
jgi:glycosyltransferase involved in cell wall biosynthesis